MRKAEAIITGMMAPNGHAASAVSEVSSRSMGTTSPGTAWLSRSSKLVGPITSPTHQHSSAEMTAAPSTSGTRTQPRRPNQSHPHTPIARPTTSPMMANQKSAENQAASPRSLMVAAPSWATR